MNEAQLLSQPGPSLGVLILIVAWAASLVVAWFLGGAYARRRKEGMTREQTLDDLRNTGASKLATLREQVMAEANTRLPALRKEAEELAEMLKRVTGNPPPPQ